MKPGEKFIILRMGLLVITVGKKISRPGSEPYILNSVILDI
jgi:hypothetical protein